MYQKRFSCPPGSVIKVLLVNRITHVIYDIQLSPCKKLCEPPVLVDGETVVQVTYEELLAIKDADKRKKPAPAKQANAAAYVPIKGCTTPPPF